MDLRLGRKLKMRFENTNRDENQNENGIKDEIENRKRE